MLDLLAPEFAAEIALGGGGGRLGGGGGRAWAVAAAGHNGPNRLAQRNFGRQVMGPGASS